MITKEEELRIIEFSNEYNDLSKRVVQIKTELETTQALLKEEIELVTEMRNTEIEYLKGLQTKYKLSDSAMNELIKKIILK